MLLVMSISSILSQGGKLASILERELECQLNLPRSMTVLVIDPGRRGTSGVPQPAGEPV